MADEADVAGELIERILEKAEKTARQAARPEFDMNFDGAHCVECGEGVEPVRLALGKVRCSECQKDFERRQWAYAQRAREEDGE